MDWRINYIDVSSCMLFETIGDSEADSNVNHNEDIGESSHGETGLAEDDAFSCSCENEYYKDLDHPTGDYALSADADQKEVEEEQPVDVGHECEKEEEEEEEDEDAVDQVQNYANYKCGEWEAARGGGVMMKETGQRTKDLKIWGAEFLNEEDKNRHFWENCLAS